MKQKFLIAILLMLILSCKKNNNENVTPPTVTPVTPVLPITRTLIGIPLDTLRKLLAGDWLQKTETICGGAGCNNTIYVSGQEDVFSFLTLDTLKKVKANGTLAIYDKATITVSTFDNSWVYKMHGGLSTLSFTQILNDTLILRPNGGGGSEGRLVKKP